MAKNIQFNIKLNVDGKDQLVTATTSVREFQKAVQSGQAAFSTALRSINEYGFAVKNTVGALNDISGALNKLTEENRSFSKAMAEANTMAGKSGDDFAKMKGDVAELASQIPVARDALAKGLYQVISNGVPEDNWVTYLEKSAKASVGGLADLEEVVKVTSTVIKNYGLEWDSAGEIQDKIQLTAKNGVTSFEQLAQALPRVTANASTLGISVDELMAAFATLTGVSGNTAEVSTQLAAIMTALIKPSSEAANMAKEMGIQFDAAAIKAAGGMQQFLAKLDSDVKSYAASTGKLETEVYGRLFGSAESLRALTPLTGNLAEKFAENVDSMKGSAGTIEGAFSTMASTGGAKMQLLKNTIGYLTDAFSGAISGAQSFINGLALVGNATLPIVTLTMTLQKLNVVQKLLSLSVVRTTLAYAAFGTNTRKAAIAMNVMSSATRSAATAAMAMKVALRGLLIASGVGIAIAAVGVAAEMLYSKLSDSTSAVEAMTDAQRRAQAEAQRQASAQKALSDSASELVGKFQVLQTQWQALKSEGEKATFIEQNQSAFAELGLHIDDVNSAYNTFVSNAPKVVSALTAIAKAEAWKDILKDRIKEKANGYNPVFKYATAKAGDKVQVEAGTGEMTKEMKAAGVKGTGSGRVVGGIMAKRDFGALTEDDAKKLNEYRRQQGLQKKREEARGYDSSISQAQKELTNALKEASTAKGVLGTAGIKATEPVVPSGKTGRSSSAGKTKDAPTKEFSIDWYEEKMSELKKRINASADEGVSSQLQSEYNKLEEALSALKIRIGINKEGTQKDVEEALKGVSFDVAEALPDQLENPILSKKDIKKNAKELIGDIQDDMSEGFIDIDDAQHKIDLINEQLEALGIEPIEIDLETDKAMTQLQNVGNAIAQMGNAFSTLGQAFDLPELQVAGVIAQAISQIALGFAQAQLQAAALGPFAWIAFAATGLAAMGTMISGIQNATSGYATGGIVGGSSTFGDKKFIRVNSGEMVINRTQQGNLFNLINSGLALQGPSLTTPQSQPVSLNTSALASSLYSPSDMVGNVSFKLSGKDLVGSIANTTRLSSKSGKKSNIKI